MTGRWLMAGGVGCLAMSGLLALEWATDVGAEMPAATLAAAVAAPTELPDPAAPVSNEALADEILARPLFTISRQPARRPGAATRDGGNTFRQRLTGVVLEPALREAVFAGEGRGRGTVVREGDAIDGWTVEDVTADSVTVRGVGGSLALDVPKGKSLGGLSAPKGDPPLILPSPTRDH